jgi:superfamily II DNA or RNA helicase
MEMIQVKLQGSKILTGMTDEEMESIKEDLTFDNPDYKSAQRHSRFGTGKIPPYITYYTQGKKGLLVPRGYAVKFPHKIVEDKRVSHEIDFPKLHVKLRGTQKEAVDRYLAYYRNSTDEHGVIILPTGKGKSILGLYLARKMRQRVLVVVQKDDLVDGWTQDAKVILGLKPKEVGKIKAKEYRLGRHVTVTTIQTLSKLPPEKIRELHDYFGMVIVDEFHHSASKIYSLIDYFPARFKIGLTATAMRNDGLVDVLYLYFGNLVYKFEDTGNDEDILPVTVRIRNASTDFQPEREYRYNKRKKRPEPVPIPISTIRKAISFDDGFNSMLVKDITGEYRQGKSCVVFTHEKEHCRILYDELISRGIPENEVQLYYGDSKTPKEVMKERAEKREVLITIATYAIATEGTNVKAWERGFLASTVANEKDTIQSIGRCRRTQTGKPDCVIYDYRFPNVIIAKNHGKVRDKVYKQSGFTVIGNEKTKTRKTGKGWGSFRR